MKKVWRVLHHLFGDDPPPRPEGHGHHWPHLHRRHEEREERDEESRRASEEQVMDGAE